MDETGRVGSPRRTLRTLLTIAGISNDPYLDGVLGAATVQGVQGQGVITSVKVSDIRWYTEGDGTDCLQHFIANEQELYRNPTLNSNNETVASISSNIDDKTMHELYLWPFQDALKAGSGNVMLDIPSKSVEKYVLT